MMKRTTLLTLLIGLAATTEGYLNFTVFGKSSEYLKIVGAPHFARSPTSQLLK
jgi:hypothetical protein